MILKYVFEGWLKFYLVGIEEKVFVNERGFIIKKYMRVWNYKVVFSRVNVL